jgi:hypothetical protein
MKPRRFLIVASLALAAVALAWGVYSVLMVTPTEETIYLEPEESTTVASTDVSAEAPVAEPAAQDPGVTESPTAAPPAPVAVVEAPRAPLPGPDLELIHTIVEPGCCRAVFRSISGQIQIVGIGEKIFGGIVTEITPGSATLLSQNETYTFVSAETPAPATVAVATPAAGAAGGAPASTDVPTTLTKRPLPDRSRRGQVFTQMLEARARFIQNMQSPSEIPAENP